MFENFGEKLFRACILSIPYNLFGPNARIQFSPCSVAIGQGKLFQSYIHFRAFLLHNIVITQIGLSHVFCSGIQSHNYCNYVYHGFSLSRSCFVFFKPVITFKTGVFHGEGGKTRIILALVIPRAFFLLPSRLYRTTWKLPYFFFLHTM